MSKKYKSKTKAQAILLKNDFFSTIRHKKWIKEQGGDALAILLSFWIESSKQPNYRVKEDELGLLDLHLKPEPSAERIKQVLDSAIEPKLINFDDGFYFNAQIEENQEAYKTKCGNISKGRNNSEKKKRQSSHNCDTNVEDSKERGVTSPIISSLNIINNKNKNGEEIFLKLERIELTKGQWDAWVLNYHHGDEIAARKMAEAASDKLKSKGEPTPDDSSAYLRNWYRKSLQFDQVGLTTNGVTDSEISKAHSRFLAGEN